MQLSFDEKIAANYTSASQRARVLTEQWVDHSVFCPNCGHFEIDKYPNNRPVADFHCSNCHEEFELKSKQHSVGTKIVDGAYRTMIERLAEPSLPSRSIYLTPNLVVRESCGAYLPRSQAT